LPRTTKAGDSGAIFKMPKAVVIRSMLEMRLAQIIVLENHKTVAKREAAKMRL
jgi:hypothetical protein